MTATTATTATVTPLSHRDRAVLRAVAAGRCEISARHGGTLVVDGLCFTDQFAGARLTGAGLIATDPHHGHARLTASGRALLEAA
ncbi:MAG TPA: hypothetical protein VD813_09940 [Pseudonocardia sp.]|nr:hypothetical protein [Pseudonocardia sp.]